MRKKTTHDSIFGGTQTERDFGSSANFFQMFKSEVQILRTALFFFYVIYIVISMIVAINVRSVISGSFSVDIF